MGLLPCLPPPCPVPCAAKTASRLDPVQQSIISKWVRSAVGHQKNWRAFCASHQMWTPLKHRRELFSSGRCRQKRDTDINADRKRRKIHVPYKSRDKCVSPTRGNKTSRSFAERRECALARECPTRPCRTLEYSCRKEKKKPCVTIRCVSRAVTVKKQRRSRTTQDTKRDQYTSELQPSRITEEKGQEATSM